MITDYDIDMDKLQKWDKDNFYFLDIRDNTAYGYGAIPGAIHIPSEELRDRVEELPRDRKIVVYCMRGQISGDVVNWMREEGIEAFQLTGGYTSWLMASMQNDLTSEEERCADIEKSIRKKFHKQLFSRCKGYQYLRIAFPGGQGGSMYIRRKGFNAYGEALSGVEAT